MRSVRRRDTSCEVAIRRILHRRGLRYFVDRGLPFDRRRRADLLFPTERVAVFVDGCFWHGCPEHGTWPKENAGWWRAKIEANRCRDADTVQQLVALTWVAVRIWEHEDPSAAADRIERVVRGRRSVHGRSGIAGA